MNRRLALVSVALLVAATSLLHIAPARAAEGVNLAWDHCFGQGTGVQNLAFACDTEAGSHVMTGSFVLATNTSSGSLAHLGKQAEAPDEKLGGGSGPSR